MGTVRSRVRELRLERGWTQQQLADAVGVSRQSINSIECDRYVPSLELALMFEGQLLAATNFRYVTIFSVIAVLYLVVCWPCAAVIERLERRLKSLPGDHGQPGPPHRWRLPLFVARQARA